MDQVRENACGVNIGGMRINNLRFADDIDLIDEDVNSLQSQIEQTKERRTMGYVLHLYV